MSITPPNYYYLNGYYALGEIAARMGLALNNLKRQPGEKAYLQPRPCMHQRENETEFQMGRMIAERGFVNGSAAEQSDLNWISQIARFWEITIPVTQPTTISESASSAHHHTA